MSDSPAPLFDGLNGYVEIPTIDAYKYDQASGLTIEAWVRPDTLAMPKQEGTGFVHWLGKGEGVAHEWALRMYQADNEEHRSNRISFYCFNPTGGEGVGSMFEDPVVPGKWLHVVGQLDRVLGTTTMFCNGVLRDHDNLQELGITPTPGEAPIRIGTRDKQSYFQGSISHVALYTVPLGSAVVADHYRAGTQDRDLYDDVISSTPGLVGYWKLDEARGHKAVDSTGRNPDGIYWLATPGATKWNP